jgi:quercetin dioxygenase-like cupin family protein
MEPSVFQHSKIYNLAENIEYSSGSVVSKVISKNDTGNLTLFAFDKGQGLSEHSAPFDALIQIIDGNGEIEINKQPYALTKGQFIIMPANVPHAVRAHERFKMFLIMIKGK